MASQDRIVVDESTLSSIFKSLWSTYLMIEQTEESTGSDKIQGEIRKALVKGEQAILMVNQLHLFSDNEDIDEVASNEIRYMLLPALLAYFHGLNTHASRLDTVLKAKNHYKDFLRMCKSYKVASVHIPLDEEEEEGEEPSSQVVPAPRPGGQNVQVMAVQRNAKIARFRQSKEYDIRLKELSEVVERESVDEELKREFYLTQVKRWINQALDELDSLNGELQILQHIAAQRKKHGQTRSPDDSAGDGSNPRMPAADKKPPLRPFILTKDLAQKAVFGLGYPAIPSMTIEEFYTQRVQDGTFSLGGQQHSSQSLQGRAEDPEGARREGEEEDRERERREEEDDPQLLQQARGMDEYKDDHRRGWGNRKNMG